ncbi:hypothetical protein HGP14_02190 [Rhizobium sp. P32RR-XVIII]|uniref:hypothetical protein n=1 Tax=Rhizobium sp. P32RR-XVIII TaxID=2726738 RepID=UPI0014566C59|nr:hypothetical protein [Rhizobium sp. P32RR-XVIII]NLS02180.1 hypothetical protein [Rhizobium sp. P32RR-XVIII]
MSKPNAPILLDNEAFMMDLFIAIINVMDLDPDIKKGWLQGLQNRKIANKEFVNAGSTSQFKTLVDGELDLLEKLRKQIPNPTTTAYQKAWLENITSDEAILRSF